MITIKRDFGKIINKHKSFINLENVSQPLLCFCLTGTNYAAEYKETFKNIPKNREIEPEDISLNDYIKDVENFILWHEEIGEDYFYPILPYFNYIPWLESIVGCPVYFEKNSFLAKPFIRNLGDFELKVDLSVNNKWLKKLLEMSNMLTKIFGDMYPMVSSAHLRGPSDIMSAALGSEVLALEMYDNPGKIKKFSNICTDAFIEVAKKLNEISLKSKFGGFITSIYGIWTENICQYFQDDSAAILSPKFYEEFLLDNELKVDKSFPSTIISVHGNNMYIIDYLINFPNLKIIQTHREIKDNIHTVKQMIPIFKKIQKYKKALIINFTDPNYDVDLIEEETELLCQELSYNGLCIFVCVKDVEDGILKSKAVKKVFKRIKNK